MPPALDANDPPLLGQILKRLRSKELSEVNVEKCGHFLLICLIK